MQLCSYKFWCILVECCNYKLNNIFYSICFRNYVIEDFFNTNLAKTLKKSDLILGNNVIAHVPDINDFVKGLKIALKNNGIITIELPHLLNIINENQFDTIYHGHCPCSRDYLPIIKSSKKTCKSSIKANAWRRKGH